jgi:hypothetical protein
MKKAHIFALCFVLACALVLSGCMKPDIGMGNAVQLSTPEPTSTAPQATQTDYDLQILDYQADISVKSNNVWKVNESITVYFDKELHGIFQEIPVKGTLTRNNGGKEADYKYDIRISDVKVDGYKYETKLSDDGSKLSVTIGEEDKLISGSHVYNISYTADVGDDGMDMADEVLANLLGVGWGCPILKGEFTITMPKEFDKSAVHFTCGEVGTTTSAGVSYKIEDNTIIAKTTRVLQPFECVVLRISLPEGYFKGERAVKQ